MKRKPTQPGTILAKHYLEPREITIVAFAEAVGRSRKHISDIIHGRARIDAIMAERIAKVLDTTTQFWINLQNAVDIYEAEQKNREWKPTRRFTKLAEHKLRA